MKTTNNYFPEYTSIKVENLTSRRSGEPVKNQFCIYDRTNSTRIFQSYETVCLKYDWLCKVLTVYPAAFDYSVTTSKYSRYFLEDYCGFTPEEVTEVKRIAKASTFGEDCPLYIQR